VGGYLGARLIQAGHDVVLIARGRHLEAIKSRGLMISSPHGDVLLEGIEATDDPARVGPVEVVIVTLKTWQLAESMESIRPLVDSQSMVLPLLNGGEASDQLAAGVGDEIVLQGTIKILGYVEAPGHIRHLAPVPIIDIGERDNTPTRRCALLAEALASAGMKAQVPSDIDVALWSKFLLVVSSGGVGAVTRAPFGVYRSIPETREMTRQGMQEIYEVARQRGVALPESSVDDAVSFFDSLPEEGTTSLQRDITEGRRSELEAWNGAVVRLGRESGVPTPVHEIIYGSLLPLELKAQGSVTWK
jgi:2-dehydropantoate 2-reductase